MPSPESKFKSEFRKDLEECYPLAKIWTSNDMFRSGVPDLNATWNRNYYSIEAKFVKKVPTRDTSKVLKQEISPLQYDHLKGIEDTGCIGVVLVGLADIAVAVPVRFLIEQKFTNNFPLGFLKWVRDKGFGFSKIKGHWQVQDFFQRLTEPI
jgi:hypothetical protein